MEFARCCGKQCSVLAAATSGFEFQALLLWSSPAYAAISGILRVILSFLHIVSFVFGVQIKILLVWLFFIGAHVL